MATLSPFTNILVPAENHDVTNGTIYFAKDTSPFFDTATFSRPDVDATSGATVFRGGNLIELDENEPDFNEPLSGGCPQLQLRPQRENLFLNSVWAGVATNTAPTSWLLREGSTIEPASSIFNGGNGIQFTGAAARSYLTQSVTLAAGTYSITFRAEAVATTTVIAQLVLILGETITEFLENGSAILSSDNISSGNYYTVVFTTAGATRDIRIGGGVLSNNTFDVTLSSPIIAESSGYEDFIPTRTTKITRSSNAATLSNLISLGFLTATEGTILIHLNSPESIRDGTPNMLSIGASPNTIEIKNFLLTKSRLSVRVLADAVSNISLLPTENAKIGISYKPNLILISVNGSTVLSLTENLDLTANSDLEFSGANQATDILENSFTPIALTESVLNAETTL